MRTWKRALVALAALTVAAGCGTDDQGSPDVGVSVLDSTEPTGTGGDETAADGATDTTAPPAAGDDAGDGTTDASATGGDGATAGGDGTIEMVATDITLAAATNEMNIQPDDIEWGILLVDDAYTASSVGEVAAGNDSKLLVVDVQVIAVQQGNLFDEAFRVEADGVVSSPVVGINRTLAIGAVYNGPVVFEIPRAAAAVTIQAGLPEELGVGRRTAYEITLAPGQPEVVELDEASVTGEATAITPTGESAEFNSQPDDQDWGTVAVNGARSALLAGNLTATPTTKLVTVDVTVNGGVNGNLFDEAFRIQADGEWHESLTQLNELVGPGEVVNTSLTFEVPRDAMTMTLEAGFPSAISDYQWTFPIRTTTFEIGFG